MLTTQASHYRGQAEHYLTIARTTRSLRDGGTYRKMAQAYLKLAEDEDRLNAPAERRRDEGDDAGSKGSSNTADCHRNADETQDRTP